MNMPTPITPQRYHAPQALDARKEDISAMALDSMSATITNILVRDGFDPRSVRAESVALKAHNFFGRTDFGAPVVADLWVSKPTIISADLLEQFPSLQGQLGKLTIGQTNYAEVGLRSGPQFELDWRAPDTLEPVLHTAGFFSSQDRWELRFSRQPRGLIRELVAEISPRTWSALNQLRMDLNHRLTEESRDPLSATALLQTLATPVGSFGRLLRGLRS